jgi:hypothetical protein
MIEIRPLTIETFDLVKANCKDADCSSAVCPKYGVEAWDGDTVVGVGGLTNMWEGVGEYWLMLHKDACGVSLVRAILKMFKGLGQDYRRVQMTIRAGWDEAAKLAEHCGLKPEGYLKGYCPNGDDAWMYARCK